MSRRSRNTNALPSIPPHAAQGESVHALSMHADFRCGNCGLCCSTPWRIPVEDFAAQRMQSALDESRLTAPRETISLIKPPDSSQPCGQWVLDWAGAEHCSFLDTERGNLCAVHDQVGIECLPLTCRLFPRLCVLQPRGVFLTLSNYCPSAAAMLFRDAEPISIIRNPPAFPPDGLYSGLDARKHLPPLLKKDVLMSWAGYELWERHVVRILDLEAYSPEEALIFLATTVEKARAWTGKGPVPESRLRATFDQDAAVEPALLKSQIASLPSGSDHWPPIAWGLLAACDPNHPILGPYVREFSSRYLDAAAANAFRLDAFRSDFRNLAARTLAEHEAVVRRYLASRLFANYFAYQGGGLRAGLYSAIVALVLLRVNLLLRRGIAHQEDGRSSLTEAIRITDFLMLHHLSRNALIDYLNRAEDAPLMSLLSPLPL